MEQQAATTVHFLSHFFSEASPPSPPHTAGSRRRLGARPLGTERIRVFTHKLLMHRDGGPPERPQSRSGGGVPASGQRSTEWHAMREKRLTASIFSSAVGARSLAQPVFIHSGETELIPSLIPDPVDGFQRWGPTATS